MGSTGPCGEQRQRGLGDRRPGGVGAVRQHRHQRHRRRRPARCRCLARPVNASAEPFVALAVTNGVVTAVPPPVTRRQQVGVERALGRVHEVHGQPGIERRGAIPTVRRVAGRPQVLEDRRRHVVPPRGHGPGVDRPAGVVERPQRERDVVEVDHRRSLGAEALAGDVQLGHRVGAVGERLAVIGEPNPRCAARSCGVVASGRVVDRRRGEPVEQRHGGRAELVGEVADGRPRRRAGRGVASGGARDALGQGEQALLDLREQREQGDEVAVGECRRARGVAQPAQRSRCRARPRRGSRACRSPAGRPRDRRRRRPARTGRRVGAASVTSGSNHGPSSGDSRPSVEGAGAMVMASSSRSGGPRVSRCDALGSDRRPRGSTIAARYVVPGPGSPVEPVVDEHPRRRARRTLLLEPGGQQSLVVAGQAAVHLDRVDAQGAAAQRRRAPRRRRRRRRAVG